MAKGKAVKKEVPLEDAPDWYGTPLDELDFGWSLQEELEIERYCEKILKNVAEEEMTPLERWKAHMAGKPKDRKLMCVSVFPAYYARTLDSYAEALKPIDVYKNPKLMVKGYLATVARFKLDYPCLQPLNYTEDLWGGRAKMLTYGFPMGKGEPPIKSMADLEGLEVPDPYRGGLYPGWLWINRELRRIIDQYRLPMPIWTVTGMDPTGTAMMAMMDYTPFHRALRNNQELARRCCDLGLQWQIKAGRALIDVARPEGIYVCTITGMFPLTGNEWIADQWLEAAKNWQAYSPTYVHLSLAYSFMSGVFEWYDVSHKRGAFTPDTFDGGVGGLSEDMPMNKILDWHREHNMLLSYSIPNATLEKGPISRIDEEIKALCELGKSHTKFAANVVPVWYVPPLHLDTAVAALKKYNKC